MSSIEKQRGRFAREALPHRVAVRQKSRTDMRRPFGYRATAFPICCDPDHKPLNVTVRPSPPIIRDFTAASGTRPNRLFEMFEALSKTIGICVAARVTAKSVSRVW